MALKSAEFCDEECLFGMPHPNIRKIILKPVTKYSIIPHFWIVETKIFFLQIWKNERCIFAPSSKDLCITWNMIILDTSTFTNEYHLMKAGIKYFPMFLNFLSSHFQTFLMWFYFFTFPGTKFVINGHFTLIFGFGKL